MALGKRQEYGVDSYETFTPVAKMMTVRILLALVASQSWPLFQMEDQNAFLHGGLPEEVYKRPPPSLTDLSKNSACRLRRSLYGLKQTPRAWFENFRHTFLHAGFQQSMIVLFSFVGHHMDSHYLHTSMISSSLGRILMVFFNYRWFFMLPFI